MIYVDHEKQLNRQIRLLFFNLINSLQYSNITSKAIFLANYRISTVVFRNLNHNILYLAYKRLAYPRGLTGNEHKG